MNTCRVRVQGPGGTPGDVSDDPFTILPIGPVLPEVLLDAPNGGETWVAGGQTTIRWKSAGDIPRVRIELSTDGGATYEPLVADTPNDGSETVTVPGRMTAAARVRIRDFRLVTRDSSDGVFAIVASARPDAAGDLPPGPAAAGPARAVDAAAMPPIADAAALAPAVDAATGGAGRGCQLGRGPGGRGGLLVLLLLGLARLRRLR
jgi:hypothetical protein